MKMLLAMPLLLAGCAAAEPDSVQSARAQSRLAELLEGKAAGDTRSCIPLREANQQIIVDERTIIYRIGRDRLYRNDIPGGCPGLDDRSTLIHRTTSSNLCSGEIFEYRDAGSGFPRGSCSFGPFTEYRGARR